MGQRVLRMLPSWDGTYLGLMRISMLRCGGLKGDLFGREHRFAPMNEPPAVPTPSGGSFIKLLEINVMMNNMEEYIKSIVLPRFIDGDIKDVQFGDRVGVGPEEELIEVTINGVEYLLLEAMDYWPATHPRQWKEDWDYSYIADDIVKLGYDLENVVKAKSPFRYKEITSDYVVRLEHNNPQYIDYFLFKK